MKFFKILLLISLVLQLISCSSTSKPEGSTEAETLYYEIMSNYKSKRYLLALEKIATFRSKYPYSFYITEIELLRADIFYSQENYLEAVDAYLSFRDFHPKHEKLDLIEWRVAESFFLQLPSSVDRDLTPALSALDSYQGLIRKFPNSEYSKKSVERIKSLEQMLEDKELYIADFYFRTKDYQSASYRLEKIILTSRDLETKRSSVEKLVFSYVKLKQREKCEEKVEMYGNLLDSKKFESLKNDCRTLAIGE